MSDHNYSLQRQVPTSSANYPREGVKRPREVYPNSSAYALVERSCKLPTPSYEIAFRHLQQTTDMGSEKAREFTTKVEQLKALGHTEQSAYNYALITIARGKTGVYASAFYTAHYMHHLPIEQSCEYARNLDQMLKGDTHSRAYSVTYCLYRFLRKRNHSEADFLALKAESLTKIGYNQAYIPAYLNSYKYKNLTDNQRLVYASFYYLKRQENKSSNYADGFAFLKMITQGKFTNLIYETYGANSDEASQKIPPDLTCYETFYKLAYARFKTFSSQSEVSPANFAKLAIILIKSGICKSIEDAIFYAELKLVCKYHCDICAKAHKIYAKRKELQMSKTKAKAFSLISSIHPFAEDINKSFAACVELKCQQGMSFSQAFISTYNSLRQQILPHPQGFNHLSRTRQAPPFLHRLERFDSLEIATQYSNGSDVFETSTLEITQNDSAQALAVQTGESHEFPCLERSRSLEEAIDFFNESDAFESTSSKALLALSSSEETNALPQQPPQLQRFSSLEVAINFFIGSGCLEDDSDDTLVSSSSLSTESTFSHDYSSLSEQKPASISDNSRETLSLMQSRDSTSQQGFEESSFLENEEVFFNLTTDKDDLFLNFLEETQDEN